MSRPLVLALVPFALVALGLVAYCLYDLSQHEVKVLPKWGWALVIVLSIPLGGVVYLLVGRLER